MPHKDIYIPPRHTSPKTIPISGPTPFAPGAVRNPRRPKIERFTPDTKARTNRNFNESPLERLFSKGKITQEQYGIYLRYRACYMRAYPTQSHEYREHIDGSGGRQQESSLDAEDRIIRTGKLIAEELSKDHYIALQMITVDECELYHLSQRFGYGWGEKTVLKRVCEILDALSRVWRGTRESQTASF